MADITTKWLTAGQNGWQLRQWELLTSELLFSSHFLLLLSWHYSPMWAFASLMELIQSSLFFDLYSQFLILHFLISPYTQSHHLDLGLPVGRLPWGWLAKTWYTIILLSILLTWPIHLNLFILIN
jgi:hypothetical protein